MKSPGHGMGFPVFSAGMRGSVRIVTTLMGGAFIGKVLGFAREVLLAHIFGASMVVDVFRAGVTAVQLPLLPMLSETTPTVLLPMHRAWQEKQEAPASVMLAALCLVLGSGAVGLMLVVQITGPWWVRLLVGGFGEETQSLILQFVRIMALWMPGAVIVECLAAAEIALGKSRIAAMRSAVLNIFVICGILLFVGSGALLVLPCLFAFSFNVLGVWGCWLLAREGAISTRGLNASRVKEAAIDFIRRLRPFISLPIFQQGNLWIERLVASGFAVGTLSSLEYARTITDTLALLISQPVGMALLHVGVAMNTRRAVTVVAAPVLSIALPLCVFLAVFAPDIVRIVFARGAFDEVAVSLTSDAMRGICSGLWAATLGMTLLRSLNNVGRNRAAALLLVGSFTVSMAFNLLCSRSSGAIVRHAFLLGSAESLRGFIVLFGVAYVLRCHWQILRMLGLCAVPVVAMTALCWITAEYCASGLERVAIGATACIATIVASALVLMPAQLLALHTRPAESP